MANGAFPDGKYMTMVKVGAKGQIVIPAEAREMLGIKTGDSLLLLADSEQGIAIPPKSGTAKILHAISETVAQISRQNGEEEK